jgi:hypothetical protein
VSRLQTRRSWWKRHRPFRRIPEQTPIRTLFPGMARPVSNGSLFRAKALRLTGGHRCPKGCPGERAVRTVSQVGANFEGASKGVLGACACYLIARTCFGWVGDLARHCLKSCGLCAASISRCEPTNELEMPSDARKRWWGGLDSNQRPADYEVAAQHVGYQRQRYYPSSEEVSGSPMVPRGAGYSSDSASYLLPVSLGGASLQVLPIPLGSNRLPEPNRRGQRFPKPCVEGSIPPGGTV